MARVFVRLKLRLLAGALRSPASAVLLVLSAVLGAFAALIVSGALLAARGRPEIDDVAAGVATGLALAWLLGPLLLSLADESLDPTRLALLPLRRRELVAGLLAAGLVGVVPVVTAVVVAAVVASTAEGATGALIAVLSAPLLLVLLVTASKAASESAGGLLRGRRGRDIAIVLGATAGLLPSLLNFVLLPAVTGERLSAVAAYVRWSPPGALATAPSLRHGVLGSGLALAYGVACTGLLLWWWSWRLGVTLTTPDRSTVAARARRRRMPRMRLPTARTRRTAVAVRELRYLRREPRRLAGWASALMLGVLFSASGARGGLSPTTVPLLACGITALIALQGQNAFGLDGTAYWLNLVSETSPRDRSEDLWGRQLAVAALLAPLVVVVVAVCAALSDGWRLVPTALALSAAVGGVLLGAATVQSVLLPIPLPERPRNAFAGGSPGQGCLAGLASMGLLLGGAVAVLPVLGVALLGLRLGPVAAVPVVAAGVAYGLLGAWTGIRVASARLARAAPELLQVLARAPSS